MPNQELYNKGNLIVYKASAGSGKTHQLTGEYLRLLFSSPYAYRHILAVTFTNKATDEMKGRIVEELANLANLASDNSSDYLKLLSSEYSKSENQIREQAYTILVNILHDYSSFSVSTIDKFFQQTMRAFTREIGLGGGYNVELDTQKVLREAIDSMLYDLERPENKYLLDWLIRFSEEKIESGETWNIRNDIQSLAGEIFKENFKASSDAIQQDISNKEYLDDYKGQLNTCIRQFEKRSQQLGEKALNIMERFGLKSDDFKGGSRSPFFSFNKWAAGEIKSPTASFQKLVDSIDNWYTKTTIPQLKNAIDDAYSGGLNVCVCDIVAHYENSRFYQTAYEINRYYFTLGILGDVDKKIREYTAENNVMLIADTTELLSKIIQDTDTPFVYEKVGTRINHYMIDEFQDTSTMQWANFLPLVRDSLSMGNRNLIVGDVKQSIYRWRNSDWKILNDQIDIDFKIEGIEHKSLNTNWRSTKNVINFNNTIFQLGSKLLQDCFNNSYSSDHENERILPLLSKIEKAYDGLYQYIPEKEESEEGHVKLEFIDTQENSNWQSYVLEQLPYTIEQLQDKGYRLKDIAILVRTKKEGEEVANRLLDYKGSQPNSSYKYDIISDEALFIRNSKSIKLIVSLLKYLRNSADISLKTLAVYEYYKFQEQLLPEEALQKHFSVDNDFPDHIQTKLSRIRELPLYEMAEEIFDLFHEAMDENENIYIQSFLDMILDFSVKKSSDLDAFLQWWDEAGSAKTVFTPDTQDAIRIMTIHKSKGLGFDVVLIPFCNWEIDHKLTNILWCKPSVEPFNRLHLVPVKYSSKLENTIFEYEYFDEKLHAYIDNINVLYVAFTRAIKELIAFLPKPNKSDISNISSLLWSCVSEPRTVSDNLNNFYLDLSDNLADDVFELGKEYAPTRKEAKVAFVSNEITMGLLPSIPFEDRLKLRLNNKYFFSESGQREYGTLMHEIVSQIQSIHDLESVIENYYLSGDITAEEQNDIRTMLQQFLENKNVERWYSGEYKVLNEVQILQPKGSFVRPDRVMIKNDEVVVIDYKFGEKKDKKYNKQVKYYVNQIMKMGYPNVVGYICYVGLGEIEEIR